MLAESTHGPFDDDRWVFEVKWDGYRALAFLEGPGGGAGEAGGGRTRLQSRRLRNLSPNYPELSHLHRHLEGTRAVVDGEIVALRDGRPDFQTLQGGGGPVVYVAFDLLELDGEILTALPLWRRRELLTGRLEAGPDLILSGIVAGKGTDFHRAAVAQGLEGIVGKRLDSLYHPGRRTRDWLKVRNVHRTFALVCGFTRGVDARPFGSLVLAVIDHGGRLVYAGHAGTGFAEREMTRLLGLLGPEVPCPLAGGEPRALRGRTVWVRPERVVEVEYLEWTRDGYLRHPVYRGLRPDKDAADCGVPVTGGVAPAPEPPGQGPHPAGRSGEGGGGG